jgi:hypothetical protein
LVLGHLHSYILENLQYAVDDINTEYNDHDPHKLIEGGFNPMKEAADKN